MDPIILLLIGISVIICCILILKLHPVLAILFAAIILGLLTGENNLLQFAQLNEMSAAEGSSFVDQRWERRLSKRHGAEQHQRNPRRSAQGQDDRDDG